MPSELLGLSFKADRQYRSCPLRAVDVTVSDEIVNMCHKDPSKRGFFEGKTEKDGEQGESVSTGVDGPLNAVQYLQLFASLCEHVQSVT